MESSRNKLPLNKCAGNCFRIGIKHPKSTTTYAYLDIMSGEVVTMMNMIMLTQKYNSFSIFNTLHL